VDGAGLKNTLENKLAAYIDQQIGDFVKEKGKTVLMTSGADRWGMTKSFLDSGYECVFGDIMFGLGFHVPVRTEKGLKTLASILMPVVGRVPFEWIYPTGEKQEKREPKWEKYNNPERCRNVPGVGYKVSGHQHARIGWAIVWHQYDGSCFNCNIWQKSSFDPRRT